MNQNIKYLITAGCSFSAVPANHINWPVHLSNVMSIDSEYNGRHAIGNELISKIVIYKVSEALKTRKPYELLVGIMWSGFSRNLMYNENPMLDTYVFHTSPNYCNPTYVIDENERNYIIMDSHGPEPFSTNYYKNYFDTRGAYIKTLENILRVQWYLQSNNIKYFMTHAFDDIQEIEKDTRVSKDTKHLFDLVDWNEWLPVKNMTKFSNESEIPYTHLTDFHPNTEHNKLFVDNVIIPHLETKGYI